MACRYPESDDASSSDESNTSDIENDGPPDVENDLPSSSSASRNTPLDRAQQHTTAEDEARQRRFVNPGLFYLYAGTSGDSDEEFEGFQFDWKTDPQQFQQRTTRPFQGKSETHYCLDLYTV